MRNVINKLIKLMVRILLIVVILNIPAIIQVNNIGGEVLGYSMWNVSDDKTIVLVAMLIVALCFEQLELFKCSFAIYILAVPYVLWIAELTRYYSASHSNLHRTMICNYVLYLVAITYLLANIYFCYKRFLDKDIFNIWEKIKNKKSAKFFIVAFACILLVCGLPVCVDVIQASSIKCMDNKMTQCESGKGFVRVKNIDEVPIMYRSNKKITITFEVIDDEITDCLLVYKENDNIKFHSKNNQKVTAETEEVTIEFKVRNEEKNEIRFELISEADSSEMLQSVSVYTYTSDNMTFLSFSGEEDAEDKYYNWLLESGRVDIDEYNSIQEEREKFTEDNAIIETQAVQSMARATSTQINISGTVRWRDVNGSIHVANEIRVEIWDDDVLGDELITSVYTNSAGQFSATIENDTSILENGYDLYIKVCARGRYVSVVNLNGSIYSRTLDLCDNAVSGHSFLTSITMNEGDVINRAMQVQQAGSMASSYVKQKRGEYLDNVKVYYPSNDGTYYSNNKIRIIAQDYCDWDVIQHEYGHHVASQLNICNSPGGDHNSSTNLADVRGNKSEGIRLAWSEGWATYFAISVQNSLNAAELNIPNVGDVNYTDTIDATISYSLENNTLKMGEANERVVSSVLYDIADGVNESWDKVAFGHTQLFNNIVNNKCTTLSALMKILQGVHNTRDLYLGEILSNGGVSCALSSPTAGKSLTVYLPTFSWTKGGGSSDYPNNSFILVFYNASYSKICEISVGNVSSYTLTSTQWNKIYSTSTSGKKVYWTIKASQTSSPATGPYYSNYSYFYIP